MSKTCWTLIPSFDPYLPQHDTHGCINDTGHLDGHINVLSDGRILLWDYDHTCTTCEPEDCECFTYNFISKEQAKGILEKNYNGSIPQEVREILDQ